MTLNYSLAVNICCCHSNSPKDRRLWKELEKHLVPLIRSHQVTLWDSGNIRAGNVQRQEIEIHLFAADLILLLVSPDFLSSSFSWEQMELALSLSSQRQTSILPILLYPCGWEFTSLLHLKPLPENKRPIIMWSSRDAAWLEVVSHVRSVSIKLQTPSQPWVNQQATIYEQNFSASSRFEKKLRKNTPPHINIKEYLNSFPLLLKKSRQGGRDIRELRSPKC